MQKIPGKQIAQQILDQLKQTIRHKNLHPKLGVLLVGDDPASELYVSLKQKAAHEIGVQTDIRRLAGDTPDERIESVIREWNEDQTVHGILLQLPLPAGHDTDRLVAAMDPRKDVDGFHPSNIHALNEGQAAILSPLHESILRLVAATPVVPNHALVVIYANSDTFAQPLSYLFKKAGSDVRVLAPKQKDDKLSREADVVVVAVGIEGFLTPNGVRHGSVVIDVGINKGADGKTRGDFDATGSAELEGWYTPVPGGVGPMTIAVLLKNLVAIAQNG